MGLQTRGADDKYLRQKDYFCVRGINAEVESNRNRLINNRGSNETWFEFYPKVIPLVEPGASTTEWESEEAIYGIDFSKVVDDLYFSSIVVALFNSGKVTIYATFGGLVLNV